MSDSESLDYLQGGFDPWSLTVPRLRSILVTYNINYPATAKKPQLIDLFNEHVLPQSKKILAQRERAKRSSMGIVDAQSSSSYSARDFMDDDRDRMPPPASQPRARSPRKSRIKQESEEPEHEPELRSPRKRQQRAGSRQAPTASDTDTGTDADGSASVATSRRSRTKTPQPQIKLEAPDEAEALQFSPRKRDNRVFTNDNPFQSGSSPPPPAKTPSDRRKTTGMETARTPSSAVRRRTDGPLVADGNDRSFSRSFEIPISKLDRPRTPPTSALDPGEEFTPEAQLELSQEEALRGSKAVAPRRRKTSRSIITTPIWVLGTALLCAYGAWYRQEKIAVGYCGVGRPARSIIPDSIELPDRLRDIELPSWLKDAEVPQWLRDVQLPDWANVILEPQCEPCPSHAFCYDDYSVRCEDGYLPKAHPLSLGGAIPLPPTCEPDSERVRRVKAVADKAVEELRDRRAKWECGDLVDEQGQQPESPAIEEEVLKEVISEKRSKRLNKQEFDDLWTAALGEIEAREEVVVESDEPRTADSGRVPTRLSSTSLARLPLACALRRSFRLGFARYRLHVCALVAALLAAFYGRSRYRTHVATSARVPALVDIVLERLAGQKELAYADPDGEEDAFLFLPNLRDDVLRSQHSLAERERVWQRVRAVVEQNSNVRTGQREGRNGEVGRAWEWIGPLAGIADSGGPRRRKSGRVSWGPDVRGEGAALESTPEMAENPATHRRWQDSRPIY